MVPIKYFCYEFMIGKIKVKIRENWENLNNNWVMYYILKVDA